MDIGNARVIELVEQRDEFLKAHPDLQPLQDFWDISMLKAGNQNNRLTIAKQLLMDQLNYLHISLSDYIPTLHTLIELTDKPVDNTKLLE